MRQGGAARLCFPSWTGQQRPEPLLFAFSHNKAIKMPQSGYQYLLRPLPRGGFECPGIGLKSDIQQKKSVPTKSATLFNQKFGKMGNMVNAVGVNKIATAVRQGKTHEIGRQNQRISGAGIQIQTKGIAETKVAQDFDFGALPGAEAVDFTVLRKTPHQINKAPKKLPPVRKNNGLRKRRPLRRHHIEFQPLVGSVIIGAVIDSELESAFGVNLPFVLCYFM